MVPVQFDTVSTVDTVPGSTCWGVGRRVKFWTEFRERGRCVWDVSAPVMG
jgi:hypothetical protein